MKGPMRINAEWKPGKGRMPVSVGGDYRLPAQFTVRVQWEDGDTMVVDVEVTHGRARARSVTVTTLDPRGVTNAVMARAPVREAIAEGSLLRLMVVNMKSPTTARLSPAGESEETLVAVKKLVGWTTPKGKGNR